MRQSRIKSHDSALFMHVFNRIAGFEDEYPFGDAEKEYFIRLARRLTRLFTVEILAYQLMGNHYHLMLYLPALELSPEEAVRRFNRYYAGRRRVLPGSAKAEALPAYLRDVSAFIHDLQQGFTRWYNRSRLPTRRGHLWADRFKSTILEPGLALWRCLTYIEMNAVRAGLTDRAEFYRFGSFSRWTVSGHHPFMESFKNRLIPALPSELGIRGVVDLYRRLQAHLVDLTDTADGVNCAKPSESDWSICVYRRMRYWADGVIVGSEVFIRSVLERLQSTGLRRRQSLVWRKNLSDAPAPPAVCCLRQFRPA